MTKKNFTFELTDLVLTGTESRRDRVVSVNNARVKIDVTQTSAMFRENTPQILIETQYEISIYEDEQSEDEQSGHAAKDPFAFMMTRYLVTIDASGDVSESDAESGEIDGAKRWANLWAHPYHRQRIKTMSTDMDIPPFELPITFEEIEEAIEEEDEG